MPIHTAVLVSWYRFPPVEERAFLLVPLVYLIAQNVTYFGLILMPLLRSKRPIHAKLEEPVGEEHPLRRWLLLPTDYGAFVWAFVLLAWPHAFVVTYTALCAINLAALLWGLRKWWRELCELDAVSQGRPSAR